jgi:hypothetical protein
MPQHHFPLHPFKSTIFHAKHFNRCSLVKDTEAKTRVTGLTIYFGRGGGDCLLQALHGQRYEAELRIDKILKWSELRINKISKENKLRIDKISKWIELRIHKIWKQAQLRIDKI